MPQITMADLKSAGFTAPAFAAAVEDFRQAKLAHRHTIGEPAPLAPPLVEVAVRRVIQAEGQPDDFVANYEIVPLTLDEKKKELADQVAKLEAEAVALVVPPGKARLWQMDVARASRVAEKDRTAEQHQALAAHAERAKKIEYVNYHAATLAAEIDDLTDETIDGWRLTPFPG